MHRLGRIPPAEAEASYYAAINPADGPDTQTEVCTKPGTLQTNARTGLQRGWCTGGVGP